MLRSTLFFLALVPFLAYANIHEDVLHDGPCPTPPAAKTDVQIDDITGRWLAVRSNYELLNDPWTRRECFEVEITKDGTSLLTTTRYRDPNTFAGLLNKKYVPVENDPGRFHAYKKNQLDGTYFPFDWTYSLIKVQGDVLLEYACKNTGNKHRSFWRTWARHLPASQDEQELVQIVKDNEDSREMLPYIHTNCDYKLV
uniref:Lipocalin/cytosolic fatty-acid binding domain-containing protein n=1 Tax=Strigamia maritima TaxID=126957 RepID=T1J003_STRMM